MDNKFERFFMERKQESNLKTGKNYRFLWLLTLLVITVFCAVWVTPIFLSLTESKFERRVTGTRKYPSLPNYSHKYDRMNRMIEWYYPKKNSQQWEEMFIRDFFQDMKKGYFVDIGASHFREASTTYFLDIHLGWRGIAVDALEEYWEDYEKFRPRTKFFSFFVGDESDKDIDFYVGKNNKRISSFNEKAVKLNTPDYDTIKVKTITLNDLLDSQSVKSIDLLSMDIELAEPAALKGFDINRFKPKLVVIERHPPVRDEIFEYFKKHGYVDLKMYSDFDARNSYFTPLELAKELENRKNLWESNTAQHK